jgi:hypothetical protein
MTLKRFILSISCLSIVSLIAAKADVEGFRLVQQGGTSKVNPLHNQIRRVMKWSNGGYLVADPMGGTPIFYSLDREGTWKSTAEFKNPEPTRLYVSSWDRFGDGTIVFSGQSETAPRVESPFLAWTSPDGKVQKLVHTDNYFARHLTVAPDDTIWTLGYEMVNLDPKDPATNQEAHVLRHFDRKGNLLGSAFPQSRFNRYQRSALELGQLVAAADRVGWYGPMNMVSNKGAYIPGSYYETASDLKSIKEFAGVAPGRAASLALTGDGNVALSVEDGSKEVRATYVLDRDAGKWVSVSVPRLGGFKFAPNLIGSDGQNLVFEYGGEVALFRVAQ